MATRRAKSINATSYSNVSISSQDNTSSSLCNFTVCVETPTVSSGVNASLIVRSSHPGGR